MEMPDRLRQLRISRAWIKGGYEDAVERIEANDYHDDAEEHHWYGPDSGMTALFSGTSLMDESGAFIDPATARRYAFEMLALADLAEEGDGNERKALPLEAPSEHDVTGREGEDD